MNTNLTQIELKELLYYNPISGIFTWKVDRGRKAKRGDIAGTLLQDGYVRVTIKGVRYRAHRLAFMFMTGKFPEIDVDHINNIRCDNSWKNLREATDKQNGANKKLAKNNKTGFKNVSYRKDLGTYSVRLRSNGVMLNLGHFKDLELAALVAEEAQIKFNGEYARNA